MLNKLLRNATVIRRNAYRRLFLDGYGKLTPDAEMVLYDLARFCRAQSTPAMFDKADRLDEGNTMRAVGMQDMYKRIVQQLTLDEREELRALQRQQEIAEQQRNEANV